MTHPEVTVSLKTGDGKTATFEIDVSEDALKMLEDIAKKRGITVEKAIIEALRLEKLFADKELLVRQRGAVRELEAV